MERSFTGCLEQQEKVKKIFCSLTAEEKYKKMMELGKALAPFPPEQKREENRVAGCQSEMYLATSFLPNGHIQFVATSDALISAGLAALLIMVYSDQPPEALFFCQPQFLHDLELFASLSPSRATGLASLLHKMKSEAAKYINDRASG